MSKQIESLNHYSIKELFLELKDSATLKKELGASFADFSNGNFFTMLDKLRDKSVSAGTKEVVEENKAIITELLFAIKNNTFSSINSDNRFPINNDEGDLLISINLIKEMYQEECEAGRLLNDISNQTNIDIINSIQTTEEIPSDNTSNQEELPDINMDDIFSFEESDNATNYEECFTKEEEERVLTLIQAEDKKAELNSVSLYIDNTEAKQTSEQIKLDMLNSAENMADKVSSYQQFVGTIKKVLSFSLNYLKGDFGNKPVTTEKETKINKLEAKLLDAEAKLSSKVEIGELKHSVMTNWEKYLSLDNNDLAFDNFLQKFNDISDIVNERIAEKDEVQKAVIQHLLQARNNLILSVRAYLTDEMNYDLADPEILNNLTDTVVAYNTLIEQAKNIIPELSEAYTYDIDSLLDEISQKREFFVITVSDYEVLKQIESDIAGIIENNRILLADLRNNNLQLTEKTVIGELDDNEE